MPKLKVGGGTGQPQVPCHYMIGRKKGGELKTSSHCPNTPICSQPPPPTLPPRLTPLLLQRPSALTLRRPTALTPRSQVC
ncbi:hypothetical protein QVD17_39794 [Tagetes erecta]|uniref:Uncharacterized protein n=1 Tax=Tagetes erecta TaxID=13708 RepID=A0AAD8JP68_TARER|nr:hypothetical protein QVD17_39794 [Tagetes erecta]